MDAAKALQFYCDCILGDCVWYLVMSWVSGQDYDEVALSKVAVLPWWWPKKLVVLWRRRGLCKWLVKAKWASMAVGARWPEWVSARCVAASGVTVGQLVDSSLTRSHADYARLYSACLVAARCDVTLSALTCAVWVWFAAGVSKLRRGVKWVDAATMRSILAHSSDRPLCPGPATVAVPKSNSET